jgi:hypothetical protein
MTRSPEPPLTPDMWINLEHVSEWVRFADTKAAGVLTLDGILATVLVTAFSQNGLADRTPVPILLILAAVFLISSSGMCMMCLLPRIGIGHSSNHVYFAGISSFASAADYLNELRRQIRTGEFETELAREIWSRSKAAGLKYRYVRYSLILLSGALATSAVIGVLAVTLD